MFVRCEWTLVLKGKLKPQLSTKQVLKWKIVIWQRRKDLLCSVLFCSASQSFSLLLYQLSSILIGLEWKYGMSFRTLSDNLF